jgi:integrase
MKPDKKITTKDIDALQEGQEIRDPILKGFGARRRKKGVSYFVHTEIMRRQVWVTIGTHGNPWTTELARDRATKILYAAKTGMDPRTFKDIDRNITFQVVFNRYIAACEPHLGPSSAKEYRRLATQQLIPYFKQRPFGTITREDMVDLHRSMADRPSAANHLIVFARIVFNWAKAEKIPGPAENPCDNIKLYKRESIARFLTVDDLGRLAEACRWALSTGTATPTQVSAILLLLLTGARRSEIFSLKREQVDRHRMVAHIKTKTGKRALPLNPHAMAILESVQEVEGNPHYFAGRVPGKHITEIRKPWDKIRKRAKLQKFRMHDFRHSFASFAADGGATAQAVGSILGHASIETTKIYMHLFNNRARETSTSTANTVLAIFSSPNAPPPSSHASEQPPTRSDQQCHTEPETVVPDHCG